MRAALLILFVSISFICTAQLTDQEIRNLKGGRVKPDNSYVYRLPFSKGSKFLLIQAYNSKMSHFQVQDKNGNDIATRFLTKKGVIYLRPGKWYRTVTD